MRRTNTFAYVANADSRDIAVLALDAAGVSAEVQRFATGGTVMPLAARAAAPPMLYAALRSEPCTVLSLTIDARNGRLRESGRAPLPASMCWVSTDRRGRFLLSASYGESVVAVSPIDARGIVQPALQVLRTGKHAHSIQVDPSNRFAFVACLGDDVVQRLRFDAVSGRLTEDDPAAYRTRRGAGPRHFVFHPSAPWVILLNELDASLDVLAFDAERAALSHVQSVELLPRGFAGGAPWAADLHLTPDGRFLYASERRSSTLISFAVDATNGRLSPLGGVKTEAEPRGFAIAPDGRFLLVVGQASHCLTTYGVDAQTGALRMLVEQQPIGTNPNWVEIVSLG